MVRHFNADHGGPPSAGEITEALARKRPIKHPRHVDRPPAKAEAATKRRSHAERLRNWKAGQANAHRRYVAKLAAKLAEEQRVKKMSRKNRARMMRNRGRGILDDAHTPPSDLRKIDR